MGATYFKAVVATVNEIEGNDPQAAMAAYSDQVQPALQQMLQESSALIARESGLMQDPLSSVAALHTLRKLGVHWSIDDFDTGYSSLAYLQQLPVNELKIDRSFVDDVEGLPGSQRLLRTMVEMGYGMGLSVTADGVETEAKKTIITELGCDVMQGYLGSRPLHGAALQAWFDALPAAAG